MKSIYALLDPRSGAIRYVGITAQPLRKRWQNHIGQARFGKPYPVSRWIAELLQEEIKPVILLLEESTDDSREGYWIRTLQQAGVPLVNVTPENNAPWRGKSITAEHRAKISAALKGKPKSQEARAAMSAASKGKPKSIEHRAAMSAQRKGRPVSPETREKLSVALRGKSKSPEHVAKVAAAQKGRQRWTEEQKAAMSESRKGRPNPRKPRV